MEARAGERLRCGWCGGDLQGGARLRGRRVCPRCGTATTDPWPSETELDDAYTDWYRPDSGRFWWAGDALLRHLRGLLAGRLSRIAPPGPVLDVGSGDGTWLDALHSAGREAQGLERRSRRPDVRSRDISEVDGEFAAVVFWHSLEHLPEPGLATAHAVRLLRPGGVLLVAAPNVASVQAKAFGSRWFALDLPRHLVHLPAPALLTGLAKSGLSIERVSYYWGGQVVFGWLQGLVGLLPGRPDLYDAIRRPEARRAPMPTPARLATLAAASLVLPVAALAAGVEVALRRGGTVYVEARRG
jgi:SAM-dependent methyltransferase